MKNRFYIFITVVVLLSLGSCSLIKPRTEPVTSIHHLDDTTVIREGSLIYALPLTVFNITVEISRKVEKAGPYFKYAGDMLGLKDVIARDKESWSVAGVYVEGSEELDPSEFYVIKCSNLFLTNALRLKKSGLILDINPLTYENRKGQQTENDAGNSQLKFHDLGADEYYLTQSDTAYRVVKLDTAFVKIPYLVEKKRPLNAEQLADKAARTILELRDGKHLLLTGEANVLPQSTAAIDEINRLEREYTALFTGKTSVEKKTVTFNFIPGKEMAGKPVVLFRFSESAGLSPASSNAGMPVSIIFTPAKKVREITVIPGPVDEDNRAPDYDKLYYRIPDVVTVSIRGGNESYYEARKLIYQFGEVVQLPSNYIIGK